MYEFIEGAIIEKTPTRVVLKDGGVGYLLLISVTTFSDLPNLGEVISLKTHFVVREDVQQLFGFSTDEERNLFRLLISVSGIGPKLGLTVLSGMSISELKRAIVTGSIATLTSISGIGKKTAERLVVELKEKLVLDEFDVKQDNQASITVEDQVFEDSLQALMSLGYRKAQAKSALEKVLKTEDEASKYAVEDLIRASLKKI
jgi:Holliday junction DNA helicase RuvA